MTVKSIPRDPWLYYYLQLHNNLEICVNCNGNGANPEYAELNLDLYNIQLSLGRKEKQIIFIRCPRCCGSGLLDSNDWVANAMAPKYGLYDECLISSDWICLEFLFMVLNKSPKKYIEGCNWEYDCDCHMICGLEFDLEEGLVNFNKYKSVVSKYLDGGNKNWINAQINKSMVVQGKACTNCLKQVPDKVLIERCKKTLKLLPAIPGDEINYQNFIVPDRNFPLFRLCDTCNAKLNQYEIDKLKDVAFDKDNNWSLSVEFYEKVSAFNYSEIYF
jgi:hypothetical protein